MPHLLSVRLTAGLALMAAGSLLAPAAHAVTRLSTDVAPVFEQIHLRTDSDSASYSGSVKVDLDVRKPTSTITLHAEGQALERIALSQRGKPIATKSAAGE